MSIFSPLDETSPIILTVPGLGGSGPSHWQTLWEQSRPDTHRVELGMWNSPHRNTWVTKLDQAIRQAQAPVVLAAHSLGCLAVAWWAELAGQPFGWPVAGALLVAPADVDRDDVRPELAAFQPTPVKPLPFPSIVVASSDDPWIAADKARALAGGWGSFFVDAGPQGHLNAASGIGWWEEGQSLLDRVLDAASDRTGKVRSANDARSLLAVSATEAAQAHYYGQHA
ncbi:MULTISPECIES: RBBP9/YdeN family alpha/beta hydrolase [unclassified Sphingomonas]|jgi:predicted alpha/beta hydrolase family esterase|uniref:RBBP9/YdeN family alpha/beta hydrolase n=1 Tax=unclassified Sphingomonas TaxID=196159 RepID=UPI0006F4317A|nr:MULTISPECIES: alpha/beta hydrolase [unclassified Sphingomonas]KRC81494.1 esterase [Sphingomonas sp. Root241]WBY07673.1 alpha/beta hydrolase [Sphingomonas sp. 7/4-4]